MTQRLILPGEVGSILEPRLTYDGLTMMLKDMRAAGQRMPSLILVSEYDRRDLNQDVMAASTTPVAKEDQAPEHDGRCICFVEGVPVMSHKDIARGKARLVYPEQYAQAMQKLGGEGLIIVGA